MAVRFDRVVGISPQTSANLSKEVSRHTVSRRLSQVVLKTRSPAAKPLISNKTKVVKLVFAEEHVTWMDDI